MSLQIYMKAISALEIKGSLRSSPDVHVLCNLRIGTASALRWSAKDTNRNGGPHPSGKFRIKMLRKTIGLTLLPFIVSTIAGPIGVVPGRILVKAKDDAPEWTVSESVRAFGGRENGELPVRGIKVIQVPERAWGAALEGLQRNPNIEFAEPDFIMEPDAIANDPYFTSAWHLTKTEATGAWDTPQGVPA